MAEMLTVTLSDRPPVKIDRDLWPVLASAKDFQGGQWMDSESRATLTVRQHADGRALVYGRVTGDTSRSSGLLLNLGGDIVAAIKTVASRLGLDDGMADRCIASLPAEVI